MLLSLLLNLSLSASTLFVDSYIWTGQVMTQSQFDQSGCQTFLRAEIATSEEGKLEIKMSNGLQGFCEMYVAPMERSAELVLLKEGDFCSPDVYAGIVEYKEPTDRKEHYVTVNDYRGTTCELAFPAMINIQENDYTFFPLRK